MKGVNLVNDIYILSQQSDYLKKIIGNSNKFELFDISNKQFKDIAFHPNGNCGCIELDDDYLFGIRCEHLMWCVGWDEETIETDDEICNNCIYIYGNHKGTMSAALLYCYLKERKENE